MKKPADAGKLPSKFAIRLLAVINLVNNKTEAEIADILNIGVPSVIRYARRYNDGGIDSLLKDKTRKPGIPPVSEETKNEITGIVRKENPGNATRRSVRGLAKRVGISKSSVNTILRERG